VTLVELANHSAIVAAGKEGTVKLRAPQGNRMGTIRLKRDIRRCCPKGPPTNSLAKPSVMLWQTLLGDLTVQKWREICLHSAGNALGQLIRHLFAERTKHHGNARNRRTRR
jgi:hypothetical protein